MHHQVSQRFTLAQAADNMRVGLPVYCSQGVSDDLRFKPLKRLPFAGRDTVIKHFDYVPPDPPPPQDFYPKQPKHWQLRGTPANRTRNIISALFVLYGTTAMLIGTYYIESIGDRWFKRLSGRPTPSIDELATKEVEKKMRQRLTFRNSLDMDTSELRMRDVVDRWNKVGGRGGDYSADGMNNPGDPRGSEM